MTTASVLLVDDEEAFAASNAKLLSNRGYDVRTALDGETALQVLAENAVDVTVLDVRMPGMDGISLLTEIKKRYPLVEVIMLSGQATFEAAVEGLKLGASDYLMKPCQITDLIGKIEEAMEKREINQEKQRYEAAREQKGAS
ncbi:MAG: response regulator [Thermodesulfobacteriota bacterium]|nr:response regulator [Thermodesulfobacteriota bacterium]